MMEHEPGPAAPIRPRRIPRWVPLFNQLARRALAAGVPMGPNALITVRGRRSGLPRTTPVTIIQSAGRRWVLAPFGEVDWVRNLRAAGSATLTVRQRTEEVTAVQLAPDEAIAVFRDTLPALARRYGWLATWIVRHVDKIDLDNPIEAAQGRPVFELTRPLPGAGPSSELERGATHGLPG
jgi:deazaflavin-dependent oxidoreductase (nitroreductase family)